MQLLARQTKSCKIYFWAQGKYKMERFKKAIRILHPIAFLVFLLTCLVVIGGAQATRSTQEQEEIEQIKLRVGRLEATTTQIAEIENGIDHRISALEKADLPVNVAIIKTTLEFDHKLMWAVFFMCATLMLERLGQLMQPLRNEKKRIQHKPSTPFEE
jgi:hypothetical protein